MNKKNYLSPKGRIVFYSLLIAIFTGLILQNKSYCQETKNLAELLGFPKDSKLLIIHADDMGLAHSVNSACIGAFRERAITSGSIMAPCPWSFEISEYIAEHPGMDVGVHLTLTAEWNLYKWDGVSPSDRISSLLDPNGYFFPTVEKLAESVRADEAAREMKAQIEKVISLGVEPTHIDTHMGSVLATPDLVKIYLALSDEYNLPVLFPREYISWFTPEITGSLNSKVFILDNLFMLEPGMIKGNWIDPYKKAMDNIKPGLNMIIVHLAKDNEEMRAVTINHDDYGSLWRQKDLDMVLSPEFKDQVRENNIILIGWKQISDLMKKQKENTVNQTIK